MPVKLILHVHFHRSKPPLERRDVSRVGILRNLLNKKVVIESGTKNV
jgi:hypothetical protein